MKTKLSGKFIIPTVPLDPQHRESKLEFTILSESMATASENYSVWEIFKEKVELKDLVPLDPKRIILHELAVVMQCYIKQETHPSLGDATFKQMVLKAHEEIKISRGYKVAVANLSRIYHELKQSVSDYILHGTQTNLQVSEQDIIKNLLLSKESSTLLGSNLEKMTLGIRAILYSKRARDISYQLAYSFLVEQSSLPKLPLLAKKNTITIFTTGGPASGKTTSLNKIALSVYKMYGIKWDDIVHSNLDRLRNILLSEAKDPITYDALTIEEARLIKAREMEVLATSPAGEHRHQLDDVCIITPKKFQHQAIHGKATIVCVVSTSFERALERAYWRGINEGRYVNMDSLLKGHKKAPISIITALDQEGIIGTNTTVFMYDNNVTQGQDSILFCSINCQNGDIIIYDSEKLETWIDKSKLNMSIKFDTEYNPNKDHEVDLYTGPDISITDYFDPLKARGYQIVDLSPKPEQNLTP